MDLAINKTLLYSSVDPKLVITRCAKDLLYPNLSQIDCQSISIKMTIKLNNCTKA